MGIFPFLARQKPTQKEYDSAKYEVGRFIGNGYYSCFFTIRGHEGLGVKIVYRPINQNPKKILEAELQKAKVLHKLGVPVPRYKGIIKVRIPSHVLKTLERALKFKTPNSWTGDAWQSLAKNKGVVFDGLVIENIEHDLSLVSKKRVDYFYRKELEKLNNLGIELPSAAATNVLWSKKKAKLYFIDFDSWKIPDKYW